MARFGRSSVSGGGSAAGGMAGAKPGSYNSASGGIPGVTSPIDTVTGNLGGISDIINSITSTSSGALKDQYPDEYFGVLGTLLGNTQRRASGDISDLLPELQQNSAEDAVYGGMSGSGAENTKLLRDLGLTRYGVQNQAIDALSKIQGQIPTVRPYDPGAIIGSQLNAQERADMYASAPVPEDAYQRAMAAANAGDGGYTPGKTYGSGGGGGGGRVGTVDAALKGYGPNIGGYGSAMNPFGTPSGAAPAPYGFGVGGGGLPPGFWGSPTNYGGGDSEFDATGTPWQGWDVPEGNAGKTVSLFPWDTNPAQDDFAGSLNYGGGQSYEDFTYDDFDYSDPMNW